MVYFVSVFAVIDDWQISHIQSSEHPPASLKNVWVNL